MWCLLLLPSIRVVKDRTLTLINILNLGPESGVIYIYVFACEKNVEVPIFHYTLYIVIWVVYSVIQRFLVHGKLILTNYFTEKVVFLKITIPFKFQH